MVCRAAGTFGIKQWEKDVFKLCFVSTHTIVLPILYYSVTVLGKNESFVILTITDYGFETVFMVYYLIVYTHKNVKVLGSYKAFTTNGCQIGITWHCWHQSPATLKRNISRAIFLLSFIVERSLVY